MIKYLVSQRLNKEMDRLISDIFPSIKENREAEARTKIYSLAKISGYLKDIKLINANQLDKLLRKAEDSYGFDTWENHVRKWNQDILAAENYSDAESILRSLFEKRDDDSESI